MPVCWPRAAGYAPVKDSASGALHPSTPVAEWWLQGGPDLGGGQPRGRTTGKRTPEFLLYIPWLMYHLLLCHGVHGPLVAVLKVPPLSLPPCHVLT